MYRKSRNGVKTTKSVETIRSSILLVVRVAFVQKMYGVVNAKDARATVISTPVDGLSYLHFF